MGTNKYRLEDEVNNFDVLKIDNTEVRRKQIERIQATRASRDEKAC